MPAAAAERKFIDFLPLIMVILFWGGPFLVPLLYFIKEASRS